MSKWGGGFVKQLAQCFYRADHCNFAKLKAAFPEYWETYATLADREDKMKAKKHGPR